MLLETSSLQYDDDQFITGGVHFDLGLAYLRGEDGVRKDTVLARKHLQAAKERHFPLSAEVNGSKVIAESRSSLNPDQLGAFNSVFQVSHPSKEGTKSGDKIKPEKLLKPED
jgi:hypothetical protein